MKSFRRARSRRQSAESVKERGASLQHIGQQPRVAQNLSAGDRLLQWLIAYPSLNRLLTAILHHPHILIVAAIAAGVMLSVWHIVALWCTGAVLENPARAAAAYTPSFPTPAATPTGTENDIVRFLAAYNQASALAAAQGQVELLSPYLAPDGPAWHAAVQEYTRRAGVGERRDATLVRWDVLQSDIASGEGWIDTQEQWNVVIIANGHIVGSRRGVLTRNRYWLRQDADGWRIVDATTVEVIR